MDRRDFVKTSTAAGLAAAFPSPMLYLPKAVKPVVISDLSGIRYRNDGPRTAVEEAFLRITRGEDVLDALIAGVNIPENDPAETGIGFGALPNADGAVQLDASC